MTASEYDVEVKEVNYWLLRDLRVLFGGFKVLVDV
jgi:hypothetical protein